MNVRGEEKTTPFNLRLFGSLVRHHREEAGYKTAEEFAEEILNLTGLEVSKETIYRVEKGQTEAKASLFFVIGLTLFGDMNMREILNICAPKEWKEIEEETSRAEFQREIDRLEIESDSV